MITLFGFGPMFGLPDPSPFVTKAMLLLQMAGLPYRVEPGNLSKAPKGKLPYIKDGDATIADSTFIRRHIETRYGFDFDRALSPQQRAIAWAFGKMADEQLYWVIVRDRWMDDRQFDKGLRHAFDRVPAIVRPLVVKMVRRQVRKALHGQGMGRHTAEEIAYLGDRAVTAIATQLGQQPYFMGADPTGADASIYAMVSNALCPHFDAPLREAIERHPNLCDYAARLTERYFPEFAPARHIPAA